MILKKTVTETVERVDQDKLEAVEQRMAAVATQCPFGVGQSYFIRTVTYHLVGRITRICGNFLQLEDASWVADSGRFTQAIREGKLEEVEPVGSALVNIASITDAFPWLHALPKEQK